MKRYLKYALVTLKELGTRCWLPGRFIQGHRCHRVIRCNYQEKKGCAAVDAELAHIEVCKEGLDAKAEQLLRERISL